MKKHVKLQQKVCQKRLHFRIFWALLKIDVSGLDQNYWSKIIKANMTEKHSINWIAVIRINPLPSEVHKHLVGITAL